ncbi:hypothetical protein Tco_0680242 [Tanacetum coccineum]|uniref:Uncharacterized protein n=1 Tax=Tanacetum coccineum TaxID=301880 RepID=A0ABQ4XL45_9ASTR
MLGDPSTILRETHLDPLGDLYLNAKRQALRTLVKEQTDALTQKIGQLANWPSSCMHQSLKEEQAPTLSKVVTSSGTWDSMYHKLDFYDGRVFWVAWDACGLEIPYYWVESISDA